MVNQRGGKARPYLELVRPPALFTAAADSITGWAWVSVVYHDRVLSPLNSIWIILCLVIISASIYAAGMCTNDIFDASEDQRDRPQRPIPSKRVSLRNAWFLALSLQCNALFFSIWLSWSINQRIFGGIFLVTLATIFATYLYNRVFKQSVVAPLMMGLCRWSNFWIGGILLIDMSSLPFSINRDFFGGMIISLGTLLYVTALTTLSRFEVSGGQGARVSAFALCLFALHPLSAWYLGVLGWEAVSVIGVSAWIAYRIWPLLRGLEITPAMTQKGVGAGIRGVALTHLSICLGLNAWWAVILMILMVIGATRMGRWFYAT